MRKRSLRFVVTVLALAMLVSLVFAVAFFFAQDGQFWFCAIAGCLFTVPFAVSAWNGSLVKRESDEPSAPPSWRDWIVTFIGGAVFSALFVAIDIAVVHPGFSLVFTLAALALTFISLPGAFRAWLVERFTLQETHGDDA